MKQPTYENVWSCPDSKLKQSCGSFPKGLTSFEYSHFNGLFNRLIPPVKKRVIQRITNQFHGNGIVNIKSLACAQLGYFIYIKLFVSVVVLIIISANGANVYNGIPGYTE